MSQQVSYADNKDEVLPGFLEWIGLSEALEIDTNELPRLQPNEVTQILLGGAKYPKCYRVCPLAMELQDQVRDATAEHAYSRIFCLELALRAKPGHRDPKETMGLVKNLFNVAEHAYQTHKLTVGQKKLIHDIRKIHTTNIRKLLA